MEGAVRRVQACVLLRPVRNVARFHVVGLWPKSAGAASVWAWPAPGREGGRRCKPHAGDARRGSRWGPKRRSGDPMESKTCRSPGVLGMSVKGSHQVLGMSVKDCWMWGISKHDASLDVVITGQNVASVKQGTVPRQSMATSYSKRI